MKNCKKYIKWIGEHRGELQGGLPRVSDRDNALPGGEGGAVRRQLLLCPSDDTSAETL